MKIGTKVAVMLGMAAAIGSSTIASAQVDAPAPPDGPMQGLMHRERLSDRLLAEFDVNHDGKITHAEFNNVLGSRFAAATHGAKFMSPEQFWILHQADFVNHVAAMFRRVDWNGDGRLTLEEFAAPQRARFQMMDRDGSGTVSCDPLQRVRGFDGFERSSFCGFADQSRNGVVTRAEFDSIVAKEFATATNGASTMTRAQFTQEETNRYREMSAKMFKRLDKDGDGKLTLEELAAPAEKLFDRLDRNHDGVITAGELNSSFGGGGRGSPDFGSRSDSDR